MMAVTLEKRTAGYLLIALSALLVLTMSVVKYEFDNRDAYLCRLYHDHPELDMSSCPVHQGFNLTSWLLVTGFVISAMIAATGGFLIYSGRRGGVARKDFSSLKGDEKLVCELLAAREGSMYQSELLKETGFSKVKLTRVLDRLSAKELVERHRRGMTNLVVLK